jgi:hypothetical protein
MHIHFVSTLFGLFDSISGWIVCLLIVIAIASIYVFMKVFDSDFKMD